jgi:hypothetical protein
MNIKLLSVSLLLFLFSCNGTGTTKTDDVKTDTTKTETNSSGGEVQAQKDSLNKQSRACIALMNSLEDEKNAAITAGNTEAATALSARIDSAARENVLIGQKLMALEK